MPRSCLIAVACMIFASAPLSAAEMPWIVVSKDKKGFILQPTEKPFAPWGFNYDHDEKGRLLEDYWEKEWAKVEADFAQMRTLGANLVRVHLQLGKFMDTPTRPTRRRSTGCRSWSS